MRALGHEVIELRYPWNKLDEDNGFDKVLTNAIRTKKNGKKIDICFTWNFFPVISRVCHRLGIPYVSWVFDSPHFPLSSIEVKNKENLIWLFDKDLVKMYNNEGINTIKYSPLAVNSQRLYALSQKYNADKCYEHDVTFLGNLYDNEFNFYDYTSVFLPDDLKSFFDNIIKKQQETFVRDIIADESIVSREKISELGKYLKFELTKDKYDFDIDILIRDIIKKKVTQDERKNLLEMLGQKFKVDLYTKEDGPTLDFVYDMGQAHYVTMMPRIFGRSKINLNFMMRSIRSGMSLRVLDIMAVGGFLFTTYRSELLEYFDEDKDLVIVREKDEMADKIDFYLKHDSIREKIAISGQEKTLKEFDYKKILQKILDINTYL